MDGLTRFSVKRPLALIMAILVIGIFGIRAYRSLNTSLMPETNIPYVTIQTVYPGAGAEVIENQVTIPIEDELFSVSGVENIQSYSMDNVSVVALEFELSRDPDQAVIDVNKKLNEIKGDFPDDVSDPKIEKVDTNAYPVIEYALYSDDLDSLSTYVENDLRPQLERIQGVGKVDTFGLEEKQIKVTLKPEAILRGVTVSMVSDALANKAYGVSIPGKLPLGTIQNGGTETTVELNSEFTSLDGIKNRYIDLSSSPMAQQLPDLTPVKVSEVANIQLTSKEKDTFYRANGKEAIGLSIIKQSNASDVEVAERVKEKLGGEKPLPVTKMLLQVVGIDSEKERYDPEIKFENNGIEARVTDDNSIFIKESVDGVLESLIEGVLLTGILLLLFLRSIKSTLTVLLAIPTSIIVTFIGMQMAGFTLNIISLLGLAMAIGILVDDSIVVIENIFVKLRSIKDPKEAAIEGRAEIAGAAVAITLVDVVVFVPLAMLTGMIGQFFTEFAVTIVVATLSSLLVAFTLTPMLSSRLLSEKDEEGYKWLRWFGRFMDWLKNKYGGLLALLTARWWSVSATIVGIFVLLFVSVALSAPYLKQEFIVMGDSGTGGISIKFPEGTNIERTNEELKAVEDALGGREYVNNFYTYVGGIGSSNSANISLDYGSKEARDKSARDITEDIQDEIQEILPKDAVVNVSVDLVAGYGETDLMYVLTGPDFEELVGITDEFEKRVESTGNVKDIQISLGEPVDSLVIRVGEKSSFMGVNSLQVMTALGGKLKESSSGILRDGDKEIDINVYDYLQLGSEEQLSAVPLSTTSTIGTSTDIERTSGYKSIERRNKERSITFSANLKGDIDTGSVVNEIDSIIEEMDLTEDYKIEADASAMLMQEGFSELTGALILSIVLMYMVMVALYESLSTPFVIMFTVPTAVSGSFMLLYMMGAPLDLTAMIGFIALMGLVAKNGILLVDFIENARKEGMEIKKAVVESGKRRLRPILMTTLAIVVASIPLVLGNVPGSEFRKGVAIVYIGGLLSSLILTLLLVPCVYLVVNGIKDGISRVIRGK